MPKPMMDETQDDFMKRCIPMVMDDGTADSNDQAVAICASMWEHRNDTGKGRGTMEYSQPIQVEEIKAAGDDWEVSGYVSTFGTKDLGGDIVRPGAFKKTLKSGPKVRFLLHHDPKLVLGVPKSLKEDSKGLLGKFKISKTKLGEETRQLIEDGALDSFSFGYQTDQYTIDEKESIRYLDEVTLYEASMVSMPMNPEATVTGWKDYLSLLGIREEMTLAERIRAYSDGLKTLFDEIRGLAEKHPLNEQKRQEILSLLETFSGVGDVRALLLPKPVSLVEPRRAHIRLAELRKQYGQPENGDTHRQE